MKKIACYADESVDNMLLQGFAQDSYVVMAKIQCEWCESFWNNMMCFAYNSAVDSANVQDVWELGKVYGIGEIGCLCNRGQVGC